MELIDRTVIDRTVDSSRQARARASRAWLQRRANDEQTARERLRRERLDAARRVIVEAAPRHAGLRSVALFGSVLQPGQFTPRSDIDVAVDCSDPQVESLFWHELEERLEISIDLRPLVGGVRRAVERSGELVYAREDPPSPA